MTQQDTPDALRNLSPEKRLLLARRLQQKQANNVVKIPPIPRTGDDQLFPVSFGQQRLWFLHQWDAESPAYHVPALFQINGLIDHAAIAQSLADIVARHEILHTTIISDAERQWQHIQPAYYPNLQYVDLRGLEAQEQQTKIQALHHEQINKPFDLALDPMMRAMLVQTHAERATLLLTIHHIACDGWSMGILLRELSSLYHGYLVNEPTQLPELPIQYADYAQWHREYLQGQRLEQLLNYWQNQLSGSLPVLMLPTDQPRPLIKRHHGASVRRNLPFHLIERLEYLSKQENATLFMLVMTAFQVLLSRYSGQTDIIVGTPIANRQRQEIENLIGFFVNTLPIRADLSGNPTFRDLLQQIRQTSLAAYDHQDIPIELLIEKLNLERNLSHTPLFQVLFVLQNLSIGSTQDLPMFDMQFIGAEETNSSKFDLTLNMSANRLTLEYDTDLFTATTIERMADHFHVLLEAIISNPNAHINDLPLLTPSENQLMLDTWNATETELTPYNSVIEIFEQQVIKYPQATAVCFEGQAYNYNELNQRANQLAHFLRSQGIKPNDRVGLFIDRSLTLLVGALGILKAGAAYVPIDPMYPTDRIGMMIEDGAIQLMLTTADLIAELSGIAIASVCLDRDWPTIAQYPNDNPTLISTAQDLMYVLFTSGSTGRPKGVAIEHGNFLNYIQAIRQKLNLEDGLSYALVSTFAADLGTTNVYGALCSGGAVHILAYARATDPEAFIRYFREHRIDVMKLVPSHFTALQTHADWQYAIPHKLLILAGEASTWEMFASIRQQRPNVRLENHYGPTETTVSMLTYPVPDQFPRYRGATVPLGKPLGNVKIYVLDTQLRPVPSGVAGELYVSGAGVARGYLNRPEQTQERFIANPFADEPPYHRLYKTGDVVRYRDDGVIEYLGRSDHQVKIRGYRVELSEIEAVLKQQPLLHEAVVILREDMPGDKRLVAYYVGDASLNSKTLREHLRSALPDYMIPSAFVALPAIPLNLNGKVDRFALPIPDPAVRQLDDPVVAPRTEAEQRLVSIWSEILGRDTISIDDNFFDLGGESFKAMRVIQKLNSAISVMDLFRYPTVRELAICLDPERETSHELLFDLTPQRKQTTTTLVAVPYGGGSPVVYQPLAQALAPEYAVLALTLPGHDFSRPDEPLESLEVLAQRCADEIVATVATPVVLYGHCVGCALTIEIARLLEQRAIKVDGVILGGNFPAPRLPGKVFELFAKLFPADRWMTDRVYRDFLRVLGGFTDEMAPEEQHFVMNSLRHDARETENYYTSVFNSQADYRIQAPIVCVVGEMDRATEFYPERYHEWEKFSHNVALEVIPSAGHYFLKHQASELATIIDEHTQTWRKPTINSVAPVVTPETKAVQTQRRVTPSLRIFFLIAMGQFVSMLGSSFSSFALGIWIYAKTGNVATFATIAVLATLPAIVIAPIAGAVADRYDRRKIMIVSDTIAAVVTLGLAYLVWNNQLAIWHLYLSSAITAMAGTFQRPAYVAAMTQLVPKAYLGKANGLIQLSSATGGILAPILGGGLLMLVGLSGVFLIDLISFLVAATTLIFVRFPDTLFKKRDEPLIREVIHGWRYIMQRRSLVVMVVFFALGNIWFGFANILVTPLVLSFATPAQWGFISGASALGMFTGGIVMSLWGGTQRRAEGMVGFVILEGLFIALIGLRPLPLLAAIGLFGMWFCVTLVNAHWQVLIQTKVGLELQGRVQATNQMLAMLSIPLGYVLAGPLADRLFEPLLASNGALTDQLGWLFGTGIGRGIGLMMTVIGIITALWAFLGFNYRPLRYMEDALPDAIPDAVIPKLAELD